MDNKVTTTLDDCQPRLTMVLRQLRLALFVEAPRAAHDDHHHSRCEARGLPPPHPGGTGGCALVSTPRSRAHGAFHLHGKQRFTIESPYGTEPKRTHGRVARGRCLEGVALPRACGGQCERNMGGEGPGGGQPRFSGVVGLLLGLLHSRSTGHTNFYPLCRQQVRFGLPRPRQLGYFSSVRGSYDPTDMVSFVCFWWTCRVDA